MYVSASDSPATLLPHVTITTDGAARGNPGPGGWAALLQFEKGDRVIEKMMTGREHSVTTNNAMEIQAVIGGLEALNRPCKVTLRIDSTYVIKGLERLLAGQPFQVGVKNDERWTRLAQVIRTHTITCEWIKGHAGDPRNEQVDAAATLAAEQAYEAAELSNKAQRLDNSADWILAICSPGSNRPVQWTLRMDMEFRQGSVPVAGITEPTAMWQGLIDGLKSAQQLAAGQLVDITVQTNFEMIVKQGRGEWKVKNATHQPFAAQLAILRTKLGVIGFEFVKTEYVRQLVEENA
jgi:ribonuclease HI